MLDVQTIRALVLGYKNSQDAILAPPNTKIHPIFGVLKACLYFFLFTQTCSANHIGDDGCGVEIVVEAKISDGDNVLFGVVVEVGLLVLQLAMALTVASLVLDFNRQTATTIIVCLILGVQKD